MLYGAKGLSAEVLHVVRKDGVRSGAEGRPARGGLSHRWSILRAFQAPQPELRRLTLPDLSNRPLRACYTR